uniref:Venom S1 protease 2 n=1 Tax=Oncocephalus sp. TaxID=2944721 RepID=A0AB38ZEG1_9HEMI
MRYWYLVAGLLVIAAVSTVWAEGDDDDDDDEDSSEHGNKKVPGVKKTTCDCGWANKDDQRIVGGEETKVNEYPFMAGIVYAPKNILFCGGTVITEYHVVTAAHCTEPFEDDDDFEDLRVRLGEHDQDKVDESDSTVEMKVRKIYQHPDYYLVGHKHDISILETDRIVPSRDIGPVCMPKAPTLKIGDTIKVIGWGKLTANGPSSTVLMKATLFVKDRQDCLTAYKDDMVDNNQICTFHPKRDSCQGDSGGPLVKVDSLTNRYVLHACVSFASGCADKFPAVNTNVSQYMKWISETVSKKDGAKLCTMAD